MPRCEASRQGLHGTAVVTAVSLRIPSEHQAAPRCINAFHPYAAQWVETVTSPLLMGLLWRKHKTETYQKQGHYGKEVPA